MRAWLLLLIPEKVAIVGVPADDLGGARLHDLDVVALTRGGAGGAWIALDGGPVFVVKGVRLFIAAAIR